MTFWTLFNKPACRFLAGSVHFKSCSHPNPSEVLLCTQADSKRRAWLSISFALAPDLPLCLLSFGVVVCPEPCRRLLGNRDLPAFALSHRLHVSLLKRGQGTCLNFCLRLWEWMLSREASLLLPAYYHTSSQQPSGDFCLPPGLWLLMVGISNSLERSWAVCQAGGGHGFGLVRFCCVVPELGQDFYWPMAGLGGLLYWFFETTFKLEL